VSTQGGIFADAMGLGILKILKYIKRKKYNYFFRENTCGSISYCSEWDQISTSSV